MARSLLLALVPWLAGCLDPQPPDPPALLSTSLDDGADRVSPTAPLALSFSMPLDPDTVGAASVVVVRGAADDPLLADLSHPPLDPARAERIAPGAVTVEGTTVRWRPLAPLAPEALHTLVATAALRAGGVPLPAAQTRAFTTGAADAGAPSWALFDPPNGAAEVVRNLRQVALAFSRPVTGVDAGDLLLVG